jgi:protein-S-isoprenylcysteine O-methyltransferase Ste14
MPEADRQRYRRARLRDALIYWLYIPGAVLGGGKGVDLALGLSPLPGEGWLLALALVLLAVGGGVIQRATRDLQALGEGTPNPRFPPRNLVIGGIYAWCRHPMFFGYDLAALGVVLLLRSPGGLLVAWPLFIALQLRFLRREEGLLRKRFGLRFEEYRRRVPLLLPRPPAKGKRP